MTYPWRKLREEIIRTCGAYDNVVVMTSGGVDSMFLANFVVNAGIKPHIVHFQHGIRENDHQEAELVKDFASKHELSFHHGKGVDLADIKNQEAVARDQRWAFVEGLISGWQGKTLVMTAHHYDDQIEHFFMSAVRGRRINALTMKKKCPTVSATINGVQYTKYKPLLDVEKDEIYTQSKIRQVKWIEDPTNNELDHERNIFRNKIIPEMMKIRNVKTSMRRLIGEFEEIDGFTA